MPYQCVGPAMLPLEQRIPIYGASFRYGDFGNSTELRDIEGRFGRD